MNLWFRLLALILWAPFAPGLRPPFEPSRLGFRVWPNDLDTSLHMNNGRYLSIMDLGRADLILRSGLWRAVLREGWTPILGAATVRYRRELRPFQRFCLETRLLCWEGATLVFQQRFLAERDGDETVHAVALLRASLYDRRARAHVDTARILATLGLSAESPPPPPEVTAFLEAEGVLRRAG